MGIYSGVLVGIIWIYCTQRHRKLFSSKFIAVATAILFLITGIAFSLNWYQVNIVFCKLGATRFSIVVENVDTRLPLVWQALLDITNVAGFVVADGLLIWRCFNVCGRRFTTGFVVPMGLFVVEIGKS
ncbi:hypothetical protein CPC08DRAFT_244189 [Agrocybe pediades]|nr:hypothetical protein CPC08DRAFT_244189 [Agrocybe pediades]